MQENCARGQASRRAGERATARDAVTHLRLIQYGAEIPELYRKFFPAQFAADIPNYSDAQALIAYYNRFARLVDERLFPVWDFDYCDIYNDPEAVSHINVCCPPNWAWCWERVADKNMHIVEKLVIAATDKNRVFPDIDFPLPAGHEFRLLRLDAACEEEKGPIRNLALLARAILGVTDNVWLDISEEEYGMSEMPEWTEDQVRFLAETYAEAKRMATQIRQFLTWCDSPGKVERVKRLLRNCWLPEGQRVRVKARPAPTLVEALGGLL